jgi:hypothetical protein
MRHHLPCRCGKPWSAEAFYASQPCYCKECWKSQMRLRRDDPEIAQRERESAKANRINDPSYLADQRQRYNTHPRNRARAIRCTDNWRRKYPERVIAIGAVAYAVKTLNLFRERCESCGTDQFVCAFHDDYSKPLKVTWNCRRCRHTYRLAQATALAISIKEAGFE